MHWRHGLFGVNTVGALAMFCSTQAVAATANASIGATVATPIAISKTADLNFGSFAVDSSSGTVVIATGGTRSFTGGARGISTSGGSFSAAAFNVTGAANATFSISLPGSVTLTHSNNSDTMTVASFTSDPSSTGTLSAAGAATVNVGATLSVAGSQPAGVYSNATGLPVTVNYN